MGVTKTYFKEQFQLNKLTFNYNGDASDFYLGSWQSGSSPVPLLCIRLFLFLGCVGIFIASLIITSQTFDLSFWPIFMTHWGVLLIMFSSGCAMAVSLIATIKGSIDSDPLPWYIKLHWAFYCVTLCVAFFITIFYYALLYPLMPFNDDESTSDHNLVLDLFVHGVNSMVMFCLLATARHPIYLLQFLYPFLVTVAYMAFSIIYYYAGGTNMDGEVWIYPVLDWSNPGPTTGLVFAVAAFLLVLHILIVCLSAFRDFLTRRYVDYKNTNIYFM